MEINFIQFFKQLPFVRILLPFLLGIVFEINLGIDFNIYVIALIFFLFVLLSTRYLKEDKAKFRFQFISGISVNVLFFFIGAYITQINTAKKFQNLEKEVICEAIISEPISEKANTFKTFAKLQTYICEDTIFKTNDKIILYFEKDSNVGKLKYGDKIIFKSYISEIKTAGNPYEFNYKKFLHNKGIVAQTYIKSNNWKSTTKNEGWYVFKFAYSARKFISEIYKKHNISGQELAVLKALTIGDKSEIDKDTRSSYVASGAMHILAVSGLHVGIIYLILNFLLKFLDKFKTKKTNYGKIIKAVILILSLWIFALISGLSPSVRRAALMFTLVIIGQAIKSNVSIYNSISVSAFILLLIDPYQITNVGFQLSYVAVISIIYFQPKIEKLFVIKNKFVFYFWFLTSVSIAAQIGTAPISLYYFHVFPNYFFIANIFVIPLAFIIVSLAFGLIVSNAIPYISTFFAYLIKGFLFSLNFVVSTIKSFPFSYTENISFNFIDLLFSGIIIILIAVFITYKRPKSLMFLLSFLFIWIFINTILKIQTNTQKQLFVYNIKGKTAINFIANENVLIADSSVFFNENIKYGMLSNWMHNNKNTFSFINIDAENFKSNLISKNGSYIFCKPSKLLILNRLTQVQYRAKNKLKIDFIVVSNNINVSIQDILQLYDVKTIVFDSSNNYYKIERWKAECNDLNQKYFSVIDSGAFKIWL